MDILENSAKIILATDNDKAGDALAEELGRRIGLWKCWKVTWPCNYKSSIILDGHEVN